MFGPPVHITSMPVLSRGFWKWRDERGTYYGVRQGAFDGQALATMAKNAKEQGYRVELDSHQTAFGFRWVNGIRRAKEVAA